MFNQVQMNRRTLLQVAGTTALTALAGCAGMLSNTESGSTTTTTTQTQGAIKSASIDGTKLVVSLSSEADIEKVNVIGPDGSPSLGSQSIPTGSTKASFNVLQSVPRGTHRAVAVSSGSVVGEASFKLQPSVEINRIATWRQTDDVEWPLGEKYFQVYLELTNTGNVPQKVQFLTMDGVPNPRQKDSSDLFSGLQTLDGKQIENLVLKPDETRPVFTLNGPLHTDSEFECGTETTISATMTTAIGTPVTESFTLVTEPGDEMCHMRIQP